MNRKLTQLQIFSKKLEYLIKKRKILESDFTDFKGFIAECPEAGDLVQGTGGLRKIRMKSAHGGKRGGFRICYYFHDVEIGEIFLITIYEKNEKEDLTMDDKKEFRKLIEDIKRK